MSNVLDYLILNLVVLGTILALWVLYVLIYHLILTPIIRYNAQSDTQEEEEEAATAQIIAAQPPIYGHVEIVYDTYARKNSGGCAICLEEYKDGDTCAAIAACNHKFHACCVLPWLITNYTCPLCRTIV
ncbi:hypothetical protein Pfo_018210 [Paulownia fortunei]|nr:hypothetical protein Pfo_018210 [Paulownia fortunei]